MAVEVIDDVPVIENVFSYTRNARQNDDEQIIIQDMPNPSHDIRTKARHFFNDDASKIEMMFCLTKFKITLFLLLQASRLAN
jgi:hypothetical protein